MTDTATAVPTVTSLPTIPPFTPEGFKDVGVAYILLFFFGVIGVHRFYLGKVGTGVLWLVTGGLLGVGVLVDIFRLSTMVRDSNRERRGY